VSDIPELKAETGFGSNAFAPGTATLRPERATPVPDALRGATIRPVELRVVGKFFDPRATTINRLAPIPGIIEYDAGRVIDARTGQAAQNHF
jgi:hypothetical protein